MNKIFLFILCLITVSGLTAQTVNDFIIKGNEYYRNRQFAEAEKEYEKALEKIPGEQTAVNNLGNVKHRLNKPEDARKEFEKLANGQYDNSVKAAAFYNTGAVLSKEKKLEESIEAYKNALRLDPADNQARENLQKALLELKKKKQPEKKKEEKKKKQQENKQQLPQSKMNRKEVDKQLQLLQQKEKEVKQRMQNEKMKEGGVNPKDW